MATTIKQGTKQFDPNTGKFVGINNFDPMTGKQLKSGESITLPPAQAPSNAAGIVSTPEAQIPKISPYSGNITNAIATTAATNAGLTEEQKYQESLQKQQESTVAQGEQSFLQKLLGSKSTTETRSQTESQIGLEAADYFASQKARIAEVGKLEEEYNKQTALRDEAINRIQENAAGGLASGVNEEVARIERNFSVKLNQISSNINAKTAIMEAEKGNFAEAQNYINQAVDDATADLKYNLDMYTTFQDINADAISRLDKNYQDALDNARQDAEFEYQKARDAARDRLSGSTGGSDDIATYAEAVKNGELNLSGVPIKIRAQVLKYMNENKNGSQKKEKLSLGVLKGRRIELSNAGVTSEKRKEIKDYLNQGFTLDDIIAANPGVMTPEQETIVRKYIDTL